MDRAFNVPLAPTFSLQRSNCSAKRKVRDQGAEHLLKEGFASVVVRTQFAGNVFLLQPMLAEPRLRAADGPLDKI